MGSSTGAQDTFQKDVQKPTMLGTQPSLDGSLSSPGGVTPSQRQRATVRVHAPPARRPSVEGRAAVLHGALARKQSKRWG